MIILVSALIIVMLLFCMYYLKALRNSIIIIKEIYPPSIINDQLYFFVMAKYNGISFNQFIRSNDFVSNQINKTGRWEECQELFNIWNSSSKKGVIIDFGANIGSCSLLFAEIGIKVYAFEPLPNNLFLFTTTIFSNEKFKKYITIFPYALGKENKIHTIKIDKKNWGCSSFYYNHHDYYEKVNVKVLNDFSYIIPKLISVIKIDVEGSEYDLFEGGNLFFKSHLAEYMYIEGSCGKMNSFGNYKIEKLYYLLKIYGYAIIKKLNCP